MIVTLTYRGPRCAPSCIILCFHTAESPQEDRYLVVFLGSSKRRFEQLLRNGALSVEIVHDTEGGPTVLDLDTLDLGRLLGRLLLLQLC